MRRTSLPSGLPNEGTSRGQQPQSSQTQGCQYFLNMCWRLYRYTGFHWHGSPKEFLKKNENFVLNPCGMEQGGIYAPIDKMGENCQVKTIWRMGFKEYLLILKIHGHQSRLETTLYSHPMDRSCFTKIHFLRINRIMDLKPK